MYFKPRCYENFNIPSVFLDGYLLNFVHCHTYLGCVIENGLNDNFDIVRQTKAVYIRGNMLVRNFSDCSQDVKIELFRAYCSNMYAANLWCNYNTHHFKGIAVAYNNVFRALMKIDRRSSISYCFMMANVKDFKSIMRSCIYSLYRRVMSSFNDILQSIVLSPYFIYQSVLFNCWKEKLFVF